jgi:hypothetical protein
MFCIGASAVAQLKKRHRQLKKRGTRHTERVIHTYRQTDRQTDRYRQTYRRTHRHKRTERQTDRLEAIEYARHSSSRRASSSAPEVKPHPIALLVLSLWSWLSLYGIYFFQTVLFLHGKLWFDIYCRSDGYALPPASFPTSLIICEDIFTV